MALLPVVIAVLRAKTHAGHATIDPQRGIGGARSDALVNVVANGRDLRAEPGRVQGKPIRVHLFLDLHRRCQWRRPLAQQIGQDRGLHTGRRVYGIAVVGQNGVQIGRLGGRADLVTGTN